MEVFGHNGLFDLAEHTSLPLREASDFLFKNLAFGWGGGGYL